MKRIGFFAICALTLFSAIQASLASSGKPLKYEQPKTEHKRRISPRKPRALIYKGEGSCIEDCSESAALMAQMVGLEPVYVSPKQTDLSVFDDAAIWIQPGGESLVVAENMSEEVKTAIRNFISSGGGYVGFCAGAFFADLWIHGTKSEGLGIMPAAAIDYPKAAAKAVMIDLTWNGKKRKVYWEEGPYIEMTFANEMFIPFAFYDTGEIAAVKGPYYQGRVIITGLHPEAPQYWRDDIKAEDPDGLDYDLAIDMIRWAAGLNP